MKKLLIVFSALVVLLSFNTAASANTIIDKSEINMKPNTYSVMTTRAITVPDGAWLGVYVDDKGVSDWQHEWLTWEVYSPDTKQVINLPDSGDYNNVIGVPAGRYILKLSCWYKNGDLLTRSYGCSATGILSSQYK
ncbi:hypothetical protein MKY20_23810 [Cytobacillus sp. FSL W8-0315]|uniref:hypothetical protein n=1 Tax=Cytobacillus sp. FSL W8-0315 TaxID=2921600 RepID=UPI0030F9AAB2